MARVRRRRSIRASRRSSTARCEARPPDTWLGIVTRDLRETVELAEREPPLPGWEEAKARLKLRMQRRDERIVLKGGGGEAVLCSSKRWFAATHALWADELLGEPGRHGALVAAPNPHVAMAYAIDDHRVRAAIEILGPWAQRRVEAVNSPISPHLYWWRPGRVMRLDDGRRAELDTLLGPTPAPPPTRTSSSSTSTSTRRG